jgi:PAS domain S-box-containing protein
MKAALPENELIRLAHLRALNVLDSEREQSFDDIAYLAMTVCATSMAMVSLIDRDRQWFKSCIGLDATETPRDVAFCAHAILQPTELLVVEDATQDSRFSDNPNVQGDAHIRFYAGAPLVSRQGYAFGTLCVVDTVPRQLSSTQLNQLQALARQVIQLLELREANQALQLSQQKLMTLYSQAPVGIALNDMDGRFVEFNPEFARLTGYSPAEMRQLSNADITPEEFASADAYQLQQVVASGRYGPYEKQYKSKTGALIPVLLNGVLIKTPAGEAQIWTFVQDISSRKRAEQLKNDFVSAVSHELRTPLTSISGALGLLVSGKLGDIPATMEKMLVIAHKNALRLQDLINDLLDMEKLIAGKMEFDMERQPLVPIIEQALEINKAYADNFNVSLHLSVVAAEQDMPLMVSVDAHRLQQVMANFLSNAIKFSPPGGRVEVQLIQQQREVKIAVVDHGPGISEEFRARLFQKFTQADSSSSRQRGGTGLGLAISKTFVERMHGRIGFDSVPGQGATFYAIFPLANRATDLPAHSQ